MTTTANNNSNTTIETVTTVLALDLNKELTQKEMEAFFSATKEITVSKARAKHTYELQKEGQKLQMYKPTMQTLIRDLCQLQALVTKRG